VVAEWGKGDNGASHMVAEKVGGCLLMCAGKKKEGKITIRNGHHLRTVTKIQNARCISKKRERVRRSRFVGGRKKQVSKKGGKKKEE